jgi:hypothetical protein
MAQRLSRFYRLLSQRLTALIKIVLTLCYCSSRPVLRFWHSSTMKWTIILLDIACRFGVREQPLFRTHEFGGEPLMDQCAIPFADILNL